MSFLSLVCLAWRCLPRGCALIGRPRGSAVEHGNRFVERPHYDLGAVSGGSLSFVAAVFERAFTHYARAFLEMGNGCLDQRLVPDHDRMKLAAFLALAVAVLPCVAGRDGEGGNLVAAAK